MKIGSRVRVQLAMAVAALAVGTFIAYAQNSQDTAQSDAEESAETGEPETAPPAATGQQTPPCAGLEYRQFDFWVGTWDVTNQRRQDPGPHAVNRIAPIHDGCVLHEQYKTGNGAYHGSSLSYFDRGDGRWHQTWIDNQGAPILLVGGLDDAGRMVMFDQRSDDVQGRITWTPQSDGTVRQHWQRSQDGGETWATLFDGIYRRQGPPATEPASSDGASDEPAK